MEKKIIDNNLVQALCNDKFVIHDDLFYKRSPKSESRMIHLEEASINFSYDVYLLAKYSLYTEKDEYLGFAMDNYKEYETILSLLSKKTSVKWNIILKNLALAYLDLRKNGFLYTDFHDKNIIIKGEDFKLVDMDSVTEMKKGVIARDLIASVWCLIDLIVEVYFYIDHIPDSYVFGYFMTQIEDKGILTKETRDFLMSILYKEEVLPSDLEKMIDPLIQEFSDQEKNNEIRKMLTYLPTYKFDDFD